MQGKQSFFFLHIFTRIKNIPEHLYSKWKSYTGKGEKERIKMRDPLYVGEGNINGKRKLETDMEREREGKWRERKRGIGSEGETVGETIKTPDKWFFPIFRVTGPDR